MAKDDKNEHNIACKIFENQAGKSP